MPAPAAGRQSPAQRRPRTDFKREVLPRVPDVRMDRGKDQTGCEITFSQYFSEHTPLRSSAETAPAPLKLHEEPEHPLREPAEG